jgi:hypothetical protein
VKSGVRLTLERFHEGHCQSVIGIQIGFQYHACLTRFLVGSKGFHTAVPNGSTTSSVVTTVVAHVGLGNIAIAVWIAETIFL